MFEALKLYLHENCRDAAIKVISVESEDQEHYQLFVAWWNVGSCHNPAPMNFVESIKVRKSDTHKWKKIDKKHKCPTQLFTEFKVSNGS